MVEQHGIVGSAHFVPGREDRGVLEFREEHPKPGKRVNIVVTMANGSVVAMAEHNRVRKAHRLAEVA